MIILKAPYLVKFNLLETRSRGLNIDICWLSGFQTSSSVVYYMRPNAVESLQKFTIRLGVVVSSSLFGPALVSVVRMLVLPATPPLLPCFTLSYDRLKLNPSTTLLVEVCSINRAALLMHCQASRLAECSLAAGSFDTFVW